MSGMQQAPPLAQFEGGDHLRQGMPPQQVRGPIQAVKDAFTPRQDEQGNPKADSLGSILSAALMSMPGTGRPVGMIPKGPKFQANKYVEPPVAANGIKAFEHERFRRKLVDLIPITSENEAQAKMLQSRMRQVDAMPENNYWGKSPSPTSKPNPLTTDLDELYGAPSPQERARLLGIKVVDPLKRDVIERGRSGRPNRTEPLGIGNEDRIIDAAMNWKPKPDAPVKASSTQSSFDSLQQVAHDTTQQGTKSLLGLDKPPPSQTHSQYIEKRTGKMSRPEFLESDALWGMARDLAAQKKMPLSQAFNELANPVLAKRHGGPLTAEELSNMGLGAAQHGIGPSRHGGWD